MKELLVTGVRFHDFSKIRLLERALWSLAGQSYQPLEVVLACQDMPSSDIDAVRKVTKEIGDVSGVPFHLLNVPNPNGRDLRSHLLNRILDYAREERGARFVSFLDYDDVLFSHAAEVLSRALLDTPAVLAYADVHCADVVWLGDHVFVRQIKDVFSISKKLKRDLLEGNFLPIHSYMFDLSKLDSRALQYDESFTRLEDYELLLRVAADYPWTPIARRSLIGLYNFYRRHDVELNTSPNVFDPMCFSYGEDWLNARKQILRKVGGTELRYFLSDFLE